MTGKPLRQKDYRAARSNTPESIGPAALAVRLTARDRWLLRMLYEHQVLTSHQIAALGFTSRRVARRRLLTLFRYGVISRFTPYRTSGTHPTHYVLATVGAQVLAAEEGLDLKELRWRADRAIGISLGIHLAHTVGVADWFTALATTARQRRDQTLGQWWSQTRCQRLWGDLVRPDAYGRWSVGDTTIEFFLEYDLGTENLGQLTRKLHGYSELAESTAITTPLLIWLPTIRRETNARRALHEIWRSLDNPAAVPIATAAADFDNPEPHQPGPAGRVWLPLDSEPGTGRVHLHQLTRRWPRLTPPTVPTADAEPGDAPLARQTILAAPTPVPPAEAGEQ
ncbi:replication-relaxation family protein [Nocardia sp. NPDC058658]|uniref:replication-relaxation family protein n=1 Tax=Nocardia sp. NPDC058658 TaxID=3346580 RepID=UPI0036512243